MQMIVYDYNWPDLLENDVRFGPVVASISFLPVQDLLRSLHNEGLSKFLRSFLWCLNFRL